ncbi:hypothetical protein KVQ01_11260 [Escherichia coli]|nr:hypothetical protein [Escherichia coli]MCH0685597.1 hypothetical protein [Escherichia coli]MDZ8667098.1 hypothetical protein [Escherichia coli]WRX87680.1 hypothetical protein SM938_22395 [Escherichia coli]
MQDFVLTDDVFHELQEILAHDEFVEVPDLETFEDFEKWLDGFVFGTLA